MKRLLLVVLILGCAPALWAQSMQMDGDRLHNLTKEYVTPHLQWAPKLSGGQLKALYVVSLSEARTAVEVAQRMDVSLDAVTTRGGPYRELGITADSDGYYGNFFEGTSDTAKAEELFNKLDQPYEVIVICGPNLAKIPARCKLKLLQQVQRGAGLVLFDVRDASEQFAALLTKDTLLPSGSVEIFGLAPLREKLAPPTTYRLGEGRVVLTRYRLNYSPVGFSSPGWWAEHENAQASLLRTLLWAARREPGVRLASPALEQDPLLPRQEQRLPIELLAERPGKLEARLRDEWNHTVRTDTLAYTGSGAIQYTLPKLPGGRYYLDLRALEGEVTHNFGFYPFRVESPVQAELVNPDDAVEGFSPIRATLKLDRPLPGAVARISLVDSPYGRIWYRRDIPLGDGTETILEARDYFMPTLAAFLRVDLLQGEETLGWTTTTYFFPYYTQHLPTYSGFSWDSQAPQPPLRNMAEYDDLGHMGIVTVMGGGWAPVTHYWLMNKQVMAHPWALHLAVGKEGQWNYRVPSWTKSVMDPADWERYGAVESYSPGDPEAHKMDAAVTRAIGKYCKFDRYPMAAYPMGNEVQVRYDGGFSPPDEIAFRAMLEKEYGDIETLNGAWGRKYDSFEAVPHLRLAEAVAKGLYPEWLAHRRFVNNMNTARARTIAAAYREVDPHARPGCDGTWTWSQGFNMEDILALEDIRYWGSYSRLPDVEVLRSLRPDIYLSSIYGWILPLEAYPELPWFYLLIGASSDADWFIAGPGNVGGCELSADYRPFLSNMAEEMAKLRAGPAQLLITTPLKPDGLAIWENYNCSVANQLGNPRYLQTTETSVPLVNFAHQQGLNFEFVTWRNMGDRLPKSKVLFLCGASSISQQQREHLLRYVQNGGVIVADCNPGVLNDSYGVVPGGMLPELFGEFPAQLEEPVLSPVTVDAELRGRRLKLTSEAPMTPGLPACTIRQYGKGQAVLLNFTLGAAYLNTSAQEFSQFVTDLLAACGITSSIKTEGLPPGSILRVRQGRGFDLVGVLDRKLAKAGKDGGEMTLTFPEAGYIYEVGKGFVAQGDTVKSKLAPPFRLFTRFSTEQKPPALRLSATSAKAGDAVELDLTVFAPGQVLLLQVRDPQRQLIWKRSESVTHEVLEVDPQETARRIHFPYNGALGQYTVTLTDAATGLSSRRTVEIK